MRRKGIAILLILGLALFLQACSGGTEALPELDQPIKLKVSIRQNTGYAPLYIAQEEGFFAEQGLDVEFVAPPRSAEAIAALLLGEIDVHAAALNIGMFNAMAQGEPVKMVANKGYFDPQGCSYFALVARQDLYDSGEVVSPADLVGRVMAVKTDNFQAYITDAAMKMHGFSLTDIQANDMPTSAILAALDEKSVDATFRGEPQLSQDKNLGLGEKIIGGEQVLPNFAFGFIMFGPSILEDDPEAGNRFMLAYLHGVRQYNEGKTERNLDILEKATELDRELLEQACWPPMTLDGVMDLESLHDFQMWAADKGLLDNIATEDQFWDSQFIDYANGRLP